MELVRLSPDTGKALNRLNVMQGQILHGKIYKMDPFSATPQGQGTQPGSQGGVAKIALGSQLIEAVVSELLPEGSSVKLEVVKLGEDSFTLRLISIDGILTGSKNVATIPETADMVEWTADLKLAASTNRLLTDLNGILQQSNRLVEIPKLSDIPRNAASLIRTAIAEDFIDPAQFTSKPDTVKISLNQAIEQLSVSISKSQNNSQQNIAEISDSINSLIKIIRPLIANLPSQNIQLGNSATEISQAVKIASDNYYPVAGKGSVITILEPNQTQPQTLSSGQTPQTQSQVLSETKSQPDNLVQSPSTAQSMPATGSQPPITQAGTSLPSQPVIAGNAPAPSPGIQQSAPAQIPSPAEIEPIASQIKSADSSLQPSSKIDYIPQAAPPDIESSNQQKYILLGLRTIARLAEILSHTRGLTIDDSATLRTHASRLTNLADAFEGSLIAPLVTDSRHAPDAIPRLLLSILFPGGHGELGIVQPDGSSPQNRNQNAPSNDNNRGTCIGIIRLQTENLGSLNVKLDFQKNPELENKCSVTGIFNVDQSIEKPFRSEIPALDRALDARGIQSDGFNVRGINIVQNDIESPKSPQRNSFTGGLDIKV
ncbi:MAG: hypothetical protein NTY09_09650 [bacterium]|nr:hypothetical protein [bacterium]